MNQYFVTNKDLCTIHHDTLHIDVKLGQDRGFMQDSMGSNDVLEPAQDDVNLEVGMKFLSSNYLML